MTAASTFAALDIRQDGFGSRHFEHDAQFGRVEVLELSTAFSTSGAEQAIRARASRLAEMASPAVSRVVRITREGQTLSLTSMASAGTITLGDLLAGLEFGTVTLSDQAILELAGATIRAVATMHQLPGAPAHGALCPGHVVVRRDGTVALAGAVFADALQALQCNREQLWRVFGLALPPSASLPRFDQRADVTELGSLVLAILLRRTLTPTEYPKGILDLVSAATDGIRVATTSRTALLMWLQQALQLHSKAMFASAIDADRVFGTVVADVAGRRAGGLLLQAVVKQMTGETINEARPMPVMRISEPAAMPAPAQPVAAESRSLSFLRSFLPALRMN
jgi:hypothetical protein